MILCSISHLCNDAMSSNGVQYRSSISNSQSGPNGATYLFRQCSYSRGIRSFVFSGCPKLAVIGFRGRNLNEKSDNVNDIDSLYKRLDLRVCVYFDGSNSYGRPRRDTKTILLLSHSPYLTPTSTTTSRPGLGPEEVSPAKTLREICSRNGIRREHLLIS